MKWFVWPQYLVEPQYIEGALRRGGQPKLVLLFQVLLLSDNGTGLTRAASKSMPACVPRRYRGTIGGFA